MRGFDFRFSSIYCGILDFRLARMARASYSDLSLLKQSVGLIERMMHLQPEAVL